MPTPFPCFLAAALAAAADPAASAPEAPRQGAVVLAVSGGPAWLGGRAGVGGLALDDVSGVGAFLGAEALVRVSPALALGLSAEGTADAAADATAPACAAGEASGCDAAYTRFTALARWSFHRAPSREAWASMGTGLERLRLARYGADARRLQVRGWEIASLAAGVDFAVTRRLGLGLFASGTAGLFTRALGGDVAESVRAPHWALRAGVRAVLRAGEAPLAPPRLPPLSAPQGSALFVEGRLGGAVCGSCGVVVGVAAGGRAGPIEAGAFAETTLSPVEKFPSDLAPAVYASSSFAGGFAGAALRLGRGLRVGVDGEVGVQHGRARAEHWDAPDRSATATVAFGGGRVRLELPFTGDAGAIGVSAFVREPLRTACVDVGVGCDALGTTVGVVLHGAVAFRRRGIPTAAP